VRVRLVIATAGLLALSTPASASAAARFANPTGSGTACTEAAPCDLVTAVNSAQSGDDVTIEPGSYNVTTTLDDNSRTVTIHGQAGAARPVITNSMTNGIQLMGPGSSVSYLELDISSAGGAGIATTGQETIDRVIVKTTNHSNQTSTWTVTGTMTNSVCSTIGANGIAVFNGNFGETAAATLRNDTLEATSTGGIAVDVQGLGSGASPSIALINSIAHGAGEDIVADNSAGGTSATVSADHSNFVTSLQLGSGATAPASGSGTNQTAPPQFVNASTGDFHELGSSSTVDAGADSSSNGSLDFDGLPRTMGAHTDIGAFEYPVPVCQAVSATVPFNTTSTLQLHCADPSGAPITSYAVVTPPGHGTVTVNSTGTATYTPASGYSGPDTFTFDATSGQGTGAPATATISVASASAPPNPALSHVTQSHRRWREGSALPHVASARPPVGTKFRFTVNESVRVRFAFIQRRHGHRVTRGTLKISVGAGAHKVRFAGRLSKHKKLRPGRYTLVITATNAVGQRATAKLQFTIVRG
jgi:hypothetical protein